MNSESPSLQLQGHLGDEVIDITTVDPSILDAIDRFETPSRGVLSVLEAGSRAILAAVAGFDVQTLRDEIQRAVGADGPLAAALLMQSDDAIPGSFVARLQATLRKNDEMFGDMRKAITDALNSVCDRQSEALGRSIRVFHDLGPATGVGGSLIRIETMLHELGADKAASRGAAAEYARSAIKGLDYEEFVTQVVGDIAAVHGDRAERSGAIEGLRQGDKRLAKRGEVTIWLGDQPVIVFEIKDRLRLSSAAVQREMEAMENRSAGAAILVVSNNQNNLMSQQPLVFLREDMWAVHLSKDDPDPLALQSPTSWRGRLRSQRRVTASLLTWI
jgi:hypothetical protein